MLAEMLLYRLTKDADWQHQFPMPGWSSWIRLITYFCMMSRQCDEFLLKWKDSWLSTQPSTLVTSFCSCRDGVDDRLSLLSGSSSTDAAKDWFGSVVDVRGIARMQRRRRLNCLFGARCRPQAVLDWLDHRKSVGFSARLLNLPGFCRSTYSLG